MPRLLTQRSIAVTLGEILGSADDANACIHKSYKKNVTNGMKLLSELILCLQGILYIAE